MTIKRVATATVAFCKNVVAPAGPKDRATAATKGRSQSTTTFPRLQQDDDDEEQTKQNVEDVDEFKHRNRPQ